MKFLPAKNKARELEKILTDLSHLGTILLWLCRRERLVAFYIVSVSENYCERKVSDVILGSRLESVLSALGKHRNNC